MVQCDRGDLVCLYLDTYADERDRSPAPSAITATGVGDALEVGETAASRVELLEDLQDLKRAGLITDEERRVGGYDHPGTVYYLTEAGREHAESVRRRVRDETVVVTNGTTEEVPLAEIDRYLTDSEVPLVTALARLTDDRRVPLERHVADSFVGRSDELETVRTAVLESFTRASRTVLVGGPSGMGKTTLVREALERVREDREEVVVAAGDCPPGPTHAYAPLRQAFERIPDDGRSLDRLDETRSEMAPEDHDEARAQRQSLFADITESLRAAATDRPVVVFLDNLQWADGATLELFAHLATTIDDWLHPVAFVGTYRSSAVAANDDRPFPAIHSRLTGGDTCTEVVLDPLSWEETRALLAGELGHHRLPDPFVDAVHDRTGGNPLFVRETAVHLRGTDRVDPDADRYPDDPERLPIPDEVTDRIATRLRTLDEASHELVGLGAVLGERVPGRILASASDLAPARHREYVDALRASRIWEPVGAPGDGPASQGDPSGGDLRFVSGGLREAVVDRLPGDRVREYHARVADAFVDVYGDDERRAARIAHHYERGGRPETAVEYYRRAGDHARETYAHREAIESYEQALALARECDDEATAFDLLESIAEVQFLTGDYGTAREQYRTIQEGTDDRQRRRRAARYRSDMCHTVGEADEAVRIAEAGLEGWNGEEVDPEVCRLLIRKGLGLHQRGDIGAAEDLLERGLEMATTIGDDALVGRALHHVGVVAMTAGEDPTESERRLKREIEVLDGTGERRLRSKAYNNLSIVRMRTGELAAARDALERCLAIQETIGDEMSATVTRGNLGIVHLREGELEAAVETYHEGIESARRLGDRDTLASIHGNIGDAYERAGDLDRAREHLERSLELYRTTDNESRRLSATAALANHEILRGDLESALDRLDDVVETAREVSAYVHELSLGVLGKALEERGDLEGALRAHEKQTEVAEEIGANDRIAGSHRRLGVAHLAADRVEAAAEPLQRAREAVAEMVDPWQAIGVIRAHGRYKVRAGEFEAGERDLHEALEMARELGGRIEEGLTLYALGECYRYRGDDGRAREHFESARSLAREVGATLIERKARTALADDAPAR